MVAVLVGVEVLIQDVEGRPLVSMPFVVGAHLLMHYSYLVKSLCILKMDELLNSECLVAWWSRMYILNSL